jgi:5'-3' exonuclease
VEESNLIEKPIISVIDADFIPFYTCHNKKDMPEKSLDDCINLANDFINNINKSVNAKYYVGFLTIGKCFRYNIYPEYKGNRKYLNQPKYLKEVKQYLIDLGFTGMDGYEADDLCISFKTQNSQYNSIIVSPDKDILGICEESFNPRLMQFNYHSKEEILYNFWRSMIVGDTADNIKGIPGMGEKAFSNLLSNPPFNYLDMSHLILWCYKQHFGEYKGIQEFYKNYMCLKIVDNVKIDNIKIQSVERLNFL